MRTLTYALSSVAVLTIISTAVAQQIPDLSALKENGPVSVREGDAWTAAVFEKKEGHKYLIKYADGTEEWVTADRMKIGAPDAATPGPATRPATPAKSKSSIFLTGQSVEAKDNARWRAAKIINHGGDWYFVEFPDFPSFREWIEPWRLRTPGSDYDLKGWYSNPRVTNGEGPPRATPGDPTDKRDNPDAGGSNVTDAAKGDGKSTLAVTEAVRTGRDVLPVAPDAWAYKPVAGVHLSNVTPTVLPPLAGAFTKYNGLRMAGTSAILVVGSGFNDKQSGLVKVNIAANGTAPYDLEGGPTPMAASPAGAYIAARANGFGPGGKSRLDLFKIAGLKANHLISFIPESAKDDLFDAQFIDEKLLMTCTDDELACWDFATATNQWKMPVKGGGTIARAPDGKTFAVSTTEGVVLIEPVEGKVLGVLAGDPVNDLAFTNDGKWLYGSTPASISVWDLEKGQPIYTLGMPNGVAGRLTPIDNDFCLIGPYLFSTAKRCIIWKYDGDAPLAASGGRVFTVYTDRKMRMLVSAVLPHPAAAKAAKDAKEAEMALKPGATVSIDLQNEGPDADKQAAVAAITRRMDAAGIKVAPGAPVRILAKTDTSTQNRQYEVHGFGIPFGRSENVTITNKTTTLSVQMGDKVLWSVSRGTSNDPGMFFRTTGGSSLQETVNHMGGDNSQWIADTAIPTFLAGPADLTTLPSSHWALGGVKDK